MHIEIRIGIPIGVCAGKRIVMRTGLHTGIRT